MIESLYFMETNKLIKDNPELDKIKQGLSVFSKVTITQIILKNYRKFVVIRNPENRLKSCYLDKIVHNKTDKRKRVAIFLKKKNDEPISFSEFLSFLESRNNIYKNAHWAPQYTFLLFPITEYCVIRHEHFQIDFDKFFNKDKLTDNRKNSIGPEPTKQSNFQLDMAQSQRVRNLYFKDFLLYETINN